MVNSKILELDIIKQNYVVVYGDTMEEAWKSVPGLAEQIKMPENAAGALVKVHNAKYHTYLILKKDTEDDEIVHECFHLLNRMMDIVGSPFDESTEELHAYIIQTLYRSIKQTLKEFINERKRNAKNSKRAEGQEGASA